MDKKQKINKKGFTLVELMIVVVIIGILAAVAIPKFTKAQYKAVVSEFPTVLTQIYTAEGVYEAENMTYTNNLSNLGISIPTSENFNYTIGNVTATTFTATATSKKKIGVVASGKTATIIQDGTKTANDFSVYAPSWK